MVLADAEAVHTEFVREDRLVDDVPNHLGVRLQVSVGAARDVAERVQPELERRGRSHDEKFAPPSNWWPLPRCFRLASAARRAAFLHDGRARTNQPSSADMRLLTLKTVLVATDLDDSSLVALATGKELAESAGAKLHVIHVSDDRES